MAAETPDPLAELRDIHLPAPPELWPPALGWWFLAAVATLLIGYAIYLLFRAWRKNAYRRQALRELDEIFSENPEQLLPVVNTLIKRVALSAYPRDQIAHLTGESWVAFLDDTGNTHDFSMGPGQILIDGPYSTETTANVDRDGLQRAARNWIKNHKPSQESSKPVTEQPYKAALS